MVSVFSTVRPFKVNISNQGLIINMKQIVGSVVHLSSLSGFCLISLGIDGLPKKWLQHPLDPDMLLDIMGI